MSSTTRAFLLAAGLGTRLRPLTDWTPKCLLTVAGRPLLAWWLDHLRAAGVESALVNTHAHAGQVREFLRHHPSPIRLQEAWEPKLLGSAGAIAAHPELADGADDLILINADNFSSIDLRQLLAFHRSHSDPVTMALFRTPMPRACGIATLDEVGRVVRFVEKPQNPESDLANAGIYVVRASAYREIAAMAAFDLGHDVLPRFVGRMRGWETKIYHRDVGTPDALVSARRDAAAGLTIAGRVVQPTQRPAVFLDRDGTLIEEVPYLCDPRQVRLLPGAAQAVRRLRQAGYATVVVTNQSGVGRGYFTDEEVRLCNEEMRRQLEAEGAYLDGVYSCPVAPVGKDRSVVEHPDRKPGPGMLLRAAADLELDLSRSWMVGDLISDVLAGSNAGCRGSILLTSEPTRVSGGSSEPTRVSGGSGEPTTARQFPYLCAPDLKTAARQILRSSQPSRVSGGRDRREQRVLTRI